MLFVGVGGEDMLYFALFHICYKVFLILVFYLFAAFHIHIGMSLGKIRSLTCHWRGDKLIPYFV